MTDRRNAWITPVYSLLALALLTAASTSGIVRQFFDRHGNLYEGLARLACGLVAVYLGWKVFGRLRSRLGASTDRGPRKPPPQPSTNLIMRLQTSAAPDLDTVYHKEAVLAFVKLIIDPVSYRSRVAESSTLEERVVTQHVSVEFSLPPIPATPPAVYVPLLMPLKGQLLDNFRLTDASGTSLPDLSFEDTTRLAAAGLHLLLTSALETGTDPGAMPGASAIAATARDAAKMSSLYGLGINLLNQIARRGAVAQSEAAQFIDDALDTTTLSLTKAGKSLIREYALALSVAYPVVAVVPAGSIVGGVLLLKYERAVIPASLHEKGRGMLRVALGIKPFQIAVPLQLGATAASYHLRLNGPANKYVRGQYFRCSVCKADVQRNWVPVEIREAENREAENRDGEKAGGKRQCSHRTEENESSVSQLLGEGTHYRVRARYGQSFVHLYLRGFGRGDRPQFRDLELFAQFKEVPPGSRGVAVVTALVATVFVGIIGHLVSQGRAPQNSDVPALMLALPAAAASWFGFSTDGGSLVGSSLLARLSQLLTAAVSFTGIAMYFTAHRQHLPWGLSLLGVSSGVWALMFFVSGMNFLYILYRFTLKLRHYGDLVHKKDDAADRPKVA